MVSAWRSVAVGLLLPGLVLAAGCSPAGRAEPAERAGDHERPIDPPLPPPAGGGFTDVTLAAGIRVRHTLPTADLENIVDALGAGAAFADLDGDGWLDLIVLGGPLSPTGGDSIARHAGIRIYRNTADGRFEDVTERSGIPRDSPATGTSISSTVDRTGSTATEVTCASKT